MKKTILCIALLAVSSSYSLTTDEEENMKVLAELGLPLPGSGIKVIPRAMMGLSSEEIAKGDREATEAAKNGYVNKYINRPQELLNIKKELIQSKKSDLSTGLSKNISEIKLAFNFKGLAQNKNKSSSNGIKVLAATPKGSFTQSGWSGVAQFFTYKDIGTCSYSVMNVKASNTAAELAQEDVTYTIHDKATIIMPVEGSESSGFLYSLKWYDDDNFHELECANMRYSSQGIDSVVELAKHIDSN